jgi:3-deoxy-D-manno-octulosonic-acid transferase
MSQLFFIFLLFVAAIIRGPLSVLLIILKPFFPFLQKRIAFERKNFFEPECRSFKKNNVVADYCFEVSSEGELEQVRPLIDRFLQKNNKIEILFASPSVEAKCIKLAREYPQNIRVFRLPLVTHFFLFQTAGSWMSAPVLLFCRYDFYPELLLLKYLGYKKFILLSGTGKNLTWYKNQAYRLFDLVVAANKTEGDIFRSLYPLLKVFEFDFRIPRIFSRVALAPLVLQSVSEKLPALKDYLTFLERATALPKLVVGSAWRSDLVIFKNTAWIESLMRGEIHLLIVPHDLSPKGLSQIKAGIVEYFPKVPVYEISNRTTHFSAAVPGLVLLDLSGVLCELYTLFPNVYVGGGFGRSIHSVLEPYLANARVFCGPRIERSTEYDFISEMDATEIDLLNNPESFYNIYKEKAFLAQDFTNRLGLKEKCAALMESIIKEIELVSPQIENRNVK